MVRSIKSKNGTSYVLCVSCSILAFTHFSHTSHIHHFTIHNIFQIVSAVLRVAFIWFGISGNFGAGGRTGSSILMLGKRVGGCGSCGGLGSWGIWGILTFFIKDNDFDIDHIRFNQIFNWSSKLRLALYCGGSGRFGIFISATFVGVKLNFGIKISIHKLILDKSMIMFGILKEGIGSIGNQTSGQSMDKLHEYESYVSFVHFPHLSDRFVEKSIKI